MGYGGLAVALHAVYSLDEGLPLGAVVQVVIGLAAGYLLLRWIERSNASLLKLESDLWETLEGEWPVAVHRLACPHLLPRPWALFSALAGAGLLVACFGLLGVWGWALGLALAGAILYPGAVQTLMESDPDWPWRLWVVDGVRQWSMVCGSVAIVVVVLLLAENQAVVLEASGYQTPRTVSELLRVDRLRSVTLTSRAALEADGRGRIERWAAALVPTDGLYEQWGEGLRRALAFGLSAALLVWSTALLYWTVITYVREAVGLVSRWRKQAGERLAKWGARVPPLRGSAARARRGGLVLLSPHAFASSALNLAGVAIGFDAVAYVMSGHTVVAGWLAYPFSWVGAWSSIVFGTAWSGLLTDAYLMVMGLPFLLLAAVSAKRLATGLRTVIWVLALEARQTRVTGGTEEQQSAVGEAVEKVCGAAGVRCPTVVIRQSRVPAVRLESALFGICVMVEITDAALALLDQRELEWAVAHELGHASQGLWRVSLLKGLSSVLLFPSYYLTICMDWPRHEVEADRWALAVTGDRDACVSALLKLSVGQLGPERDDSVLPGRAGEWVKSAEVAVRFHFGEGLLGYAHPFLSERLRALKGNNATDR
jgi:Zn-dependent protease with chaperone function